MGSTRPTPTEAEIQAQFDGAIGFLVHDVARSFTAAYAELAKPLGLTRPQARVIAHVARYPGISQKDLAAIMSVSTMSITGILDRMEDKQLVRRGMDPSDRRVRRVYLTAEAQDLLIDISRMSDILTSVATSSISEANKQRLLSTLRVVKCNLDAFITELSNSDQTESQEQP